ncbi:glycosyltransferase family 39 protein [Tepidimonas charontis]|uniref:Lipopolysaccharide core galacturonosyltransferase RgtA n=1 Tax=Tepidimonas charontis TaxID=2267262 RepID=A0A554XEH6_9BURK|nr:glycosyltransferase family 39 protein [Tepidimonas charontis]TSE34225.1 Lipopolysaccharide core galacturonosyltransferase RgtA [Tepidimonas charontis]
MPASSATPSPLRPLPPAALGALATLLLAQALVLSVLRGGTSYDGAEQLLYTQYLDWGYGRSQPPLYTWLLWGMHQVLGVGPWAENLLKFTLLGVGLCGMAWLAQALYPRVRYAGGAALLLCLLVPDIVWEMQRNYAHSVLLFALLPWGGWLYLRACNQPTPARLLALALVAALSVLAKYNAALFWAGVALGDVLANGRRALPARPAAWAAALLALALLLPHIAWVVQHPGPSLVIADRMGVNALGAPWRNAAAGAFEWLVACLGLFALPTLVITVGLLHSRTTARGNDDRETGGHPPPWSAALRRLGIGCAAANCTHRCLWLYASAAALALSLLVVLLSGMTRVQPRWLLPTAVPLLALAAGWVAGQGRAWRLLRWAGLTIGVIVIVGNWWAAVKPGARTAYDYAALSAVLRAQTDADCAVFTDYAHFANLRLVDPSWRLANPAMPRQVGLAAAHRPVALWLAHDAAARQATLAFAAAQGWVPLGPPETVVLPRRWPGRDALVAVQRLQRRLVATSAPPAPNAAGVAAPGRP